LARVQEAARDSIGTHDLDRQRGLVLEQCQLMQELRLLQAQLQELDLEIRQIVERVRQGQILLSIPAIGPIQAAALIAAHAGLPHAPE
jgi:transposase